MTELEEQKDEQTINKDELFSSLDPETLAPELKQIYKGMQADYTRKTQDVAGRRKEFDDRETQFEDKLKEYGAVEQEVKQWRDWYANLEENPDNGTGEPKTTTPAEPTGQTPNYLEEPGMENVKKYVTDLTSKHDGELTAVKSEVEKLQTMLKDNTDQTSRMFSYHAQLNDLAGEYKDLNKQELLDYALKAGQMDLTKAYKDLHQDDLIEEQVKVRVEEELKKQRTQGIRGPGQQILVKRGKDTHKTFEEATQSILDDRAAKGL
jgi:hypothetical protein